MAAEDKSVQQMQAAGSKLMQSSPGLAEKVVRDASHTKKAGGAGRDDRDTLIQELQRQLGEEKEKNRSLEDQIKYRVASFVKRETTTKNKIESLERRLNEGTDQDEYMRRMGVIENMHKSVVGGIECIQNNTARILQEQEKDLMRAFRARLQDVSRDLEAQRSKKGEHSTELQARHRRMVAELHEAQDLAQTFDKKNQQLTTDNAKLQEKLRTREDDRQALLKELVLSRKEAARWKAASRGETQDSQARTPGLAQPVESQSQQDLARKNFTQKQIDQQRLQESHNKTYEREVKYRDAITKLKRMVESERKQVRALKEQQAAIMQQRTELEVLLRQCLDDVKAEIMRQRLSHERKDGPSLPEPGAPIASMSVHELTAQDRERVLELLLSQQRVVQLLYNKTFPHQPPTPMMDVPATPNRNDGKDDFSWLSDIIPPDAS
eukprot:gnl/TRDRNA2_/TRDRNA2_187819_c0_seq1.p1 gnl/TRDRNA2_/TRDRNA2_187819_c0~~gnl/TRDRNA2_/TRDRNA2_187819_c0_seq1.p1  ORF type:complete len:437 (+),score=129.05 gnl/TRDRNA2_/TRDRNA2_187819_c0_seq1:166-1476(+)